jgi:hypothetical protein
MEYVNNVHDRRWVDEDTPGARGYEYIEIVADDSEYTSAFSCELVGLGPGDQSLSHVEDYNHLLFFVEGSGEITISKRTWPLSPGSYAKVKAGEEPCTTRRACARDHDVGSTRPPQASCRGVARQPQSRTLRLTRRHGCRFRSASRLRRANERGQRASRSAGRR